MKQKWEKKRRENEEKEKALEKKQHGKFICQLFSFYYLKRKLVPSALFYTPSPQMKNESLEDIETQHMKLFVALYEGEGMLARDVRIATIVKEQI